MIITLKNIIEKYDLYGEHRLNGVKVVYIILVMFFINMVYTIPNPYFNYFYVPITAMNAEIVGTTPKAKYILFFYTVIGAIISVFLFDLTVSYPIFFLIFVFFYSIALYLMALHWIKNLMVPVPLILSLAVYSLVYGQISTDFYIALNNALITLLATVIITACLILFPKRYYFRAWMRALLHLLKQIQGNFKLIQHNMEIQIEPVQGHLMMLAKYAKFLPRKLPIFTILKINLLVNELRLISCVTDQKLFKMEQQTLEHVINRLNKLITAIEQKQKCQIDQCDYPLLYQIISTWNNLCLKM